MSELIIFQIVCSILQNNQLDDIDDGIDDSDLIQLSSCGIETEWTFPADQISCPNRHCLKEFNSRSDAIIHFKREHSKKAIMCDMCNKPISGGSVSTFVAHYRHAHPFKQLPFGLGDNGAYSTGNQVPFKLRIYIN